MYSHHPAGTDEGAGSLIVTDDAAGDDDRVGVYMLLVVKGGSWSSLAF